MKKKLAVCLAIGLFLVNIVGTVRANLITNGDFESGDTGFVTDYSNVGIGVTGSAYSITTNPSLNHSLAASYGDHTSGTGYMMAVNGSNIANQIIWGQNVDLQSNTDYKFSIFISSWYPTNLADLTFSLNSGDIILGTVTAPANTGIWEEFAVSFNSETLSGMTSISFIDTDLSWGGNDFAIDDISLIAEPVPEPGTMFLFGTGIAVLAGTRIRRRNPGRDAGSF